MSGTGRMQALRDIYRDMEKICYSVSFGSEIILPRQCAGRLASGGDRHIVTYKKGAVIMPTDIVTLFSDGSYFGDARVSHVFVKPYHELTDFDAVAAGFSSLTELNDEMEKMHGLIGSHELVALQKISQLKPAQELQSA